MNYKTQKFTGLQLKELVEKGKTTVCEAVKEGKHGGKNVSNEPVGIVHTVYDSKGIVICKVGEIRQAVNEKGEKQYYCEPCKRFYPEGTAHAAYIEDGFLVRVEKIGEEYGEWIRNYSKVAEKQFILVIFYERIK